MFVVSGLSRILFALIVWFGRSVVSHRLWSFYPVAALKIALLDASRDWFLFLLSVVYTINV